MRKPSISALGRKGEIATVDGGSTLIMRWAPCAAGRPCSSVGPSVISCGGGFPIKREFRFTRPDHGRLCRIGIERGLLKRGEARRCRPNAVGAASQLRLTDKADRIADTKRFRAAPTVQPRNRYSVPTPHGSASTRLAVYLVMEGCQAATHVETAVACHTWPMPSSPLGRVSSQSIEGR